MSWLTGLAEKAETFLDKIDQNAAKTLRTSGDSTSLCDVPLLEVSSEGESHLSSVAVEKVLPHSSPVSKSPMKLVSGHSSPNHSIQIVAKKEVESFNDSSQFLNNFNPHQIDTLSPIKTSLEIKETNGGRDADLIAENQLLRNEIRILNNELSSSLHRTKLSQKDMNKMKNNLKELEKKNKKLNNEIQNISSQLSDALNTSKNLQTENQRLCVSNSDESEKSALVAAQKQITDLRTDSERTEEILRGQIATLNEKLNDANEVRLELIRKVNALESTLEILKSESQQQRERMSEVQVELDQYRARAQRTLSDKEKLITELKQALSNNSNGSVVDDKVGDIERTQLRKELESLQEENDQLASRLTSSREQLHAADVCISEIREEALLTQKKLQENLQEEIQKRLIVEEDCKLQLEELQAVREELARQRSQIAGRLKEREAELSRLRAQLTQRPISPPPAELESRIHSLTKTLVDKQNTVETMMIEKNSLKLQLEKMEAQQRELISRLKQPQGRIINVNDTDDAKAQVPSFLLESPYDTGVARRVKRAYSSLDTFSIRTGVFLRRFPVARIFLLPYIVILHLWVFLVLFWNTPESTST